MAYMGAERSAVEKKMKWVTLQKHQQQTETPKPVQPFARNVIFLVCQSVLKILNHMPLVNFISSPHVSLKHLTKALDRLVLYLHDAFLASQKEIEKISFTDV